MNPKQTKCPECSYESIRESNKDKHEDLMEHIRREHKELYHTLEVLNEKQTNMQ